MNSKLFLNRLATDLIPLADAKAHIEVEHSNDDVKIQQYIDASIAHTENVTRRTFPLTEYLVTVDEFGDEVKIFSPPPRGVGTVTYWDGTARQTLSTDDYEIDTDWNTLTLRPTTTFPSGEAIKFNLISGYGTYSGYVGYDQAYPVAYEGGTIPDVLFPYDLVQACHLLVGAFYENREALSPTSLTRIPLGYDALVMKYRAYRI